MAGAYERPLTGQMRAALERAPRLIQVLVGPRQVGKTTVAVAIANQWAGPARVVSADEMLPPSVEWIRTHWDAARRDSREARALLVLDKVQKVPGWSEVVKARWDADRRAGTDLDFVLLGSSALLLATGTTESLAGRFFLHRCTHWSFSECRDAFGWDLDRWMWFGGYPGAATLVGDEITWKRYVRDSLVEAAIARDVLSLERITKPALLRHLFALAASYPAQILSYNKMLGQLQDAGNTTTLARYLRLLERSFLVSGLERYSKAPRARGSSPKLVLWNNALVTALAHRALAEARTDHESWGHLVENAVGAHLLNHLQDLPESIYWWRERAHEVDYVVRSGSRLLAIEVKSGAKARSGDRSGLTAFAKQHPGARTLVVGPGGLSLEEFFVTRPAELL